MLAAGEQTFAVARTATAAPPVCRSNATSVRSSLPGSPTRKNMRRASRATNAADMQKNAEGAIDLELGPKSPRGQRIEPNYIAGIQGVSSS